jgi:zinc-binding alcohol dehydrogenase family protein
MRAVGYFAPGPIAAPDSLRDIELPRPSATGRDLLVEVRAVSVNPVDYKVRASAPAPEGAAKVIGWDAAGIVVEAGPQATLFKVGDEVFYAGSIARPGTNAQFHLVDERIVGHKPRSVGFAQAAALPLTAITAWEALFDRIDIRRPVPGAALADPTAGEVRIAAPIVHGRRFRCHRNRQAYPTTSARRVSPAWLSKMSRLAMNSMAVALSGDRIGASETVVAFVFATWRLSE